MDGHYDQPTVPGDLWKELWLSICPAVVREIVFSTGPFEANSTVVKTHGHLKSIGNPITELGK